ncbi:MAG: restriction endonuclease subunit S [Lachnospiraceae bacterium]|nr:restriction endonuclease subunit S [Lachnospiraceae bacterium]
MGYDERTIGEIADVTKLAGFEFTKHIEYIEDGEIIALRALNLRNGELDLTDIKRIDHTVSESLVRSKLFVNDILLTYTGNGYGDCAIIEEDDKYHLAPNICKIVPNTEIVNPYFLYCYIRSSAFYKQMSNNMTGSGQPTIPMKTIRTLKVPVPKREIQNNIASLLRTINHKIRINKEINNNLVA